MATYTVSSGRLICTGTDITTAGIVSAVNANSGSLNSVGGVTSTASYEDTAGRGSRRSPAKAIIIAEINIGNGGTTPSTWQTNREDITIRGEYFRVDGGHFKLGSKLANGTLTNPSNFYYDSTATAENAAAWQRWIMENGGQITAYGGSLATHRVLTATYTTGDVYLEGVYCSIEFGVGDGGSYTGNSFTNSPVYTYKNCVFDQHVGGVGNKLYQYITYVLENNKVTNNNFGIQPGPQALVLSDYSLDTNVYHSVPNIGNCDVTLINSDITALRGVAANANDIHRLAQRFDYKSVASSGSALSGVLVRIIDQTGSVVVNNESTDASGRISTLPTYSGIKCLQYKTYAGNTETIKATHTFLSYKYGYGITSKEIVVQSNADITETDFKLEDPSISEGSKSTVNAYSEINTAAKLYDISAAYLEDNLGTYTDFLATRSGNLIDAGAYNVTIDATASSVFAVSGNTITIKASNFTGDMITAGLITLANGATFSGTRTDTNGTVLPDSILTLTGLQPNSEVRIYQAGTTTEVDGIENSGTSFSTTTTESSIDLVIFNTQYQPVRTLAVDTSTDVTLPIQQIFDRNYNNP